LGQADSIGQSDADIVGLQTRLLLQNLTFRYTLSQHPHNEFNRDTGAPNNRFAHHDFGVDAHTLPKLFVHSLLPPALARGALSAKNLPLDFFDQAGQVGLMKADFRCRNPIMLDVR
jgi:hypothetical protein